MATLAACSGGRNSGGSGNAAPVAVITSPLDGNVYTLGDTISPDGTDAYDPQVAMDDNGNAIIASAIVTWYQYDGYNYQIFMSEYR